MTHQPAPPERLSGIVAIPLVDIVPITPEPADFYRTATLAEWEARMAEKYGASTPGDQE